MKRLKIYDQAEKLLQEVYIFIALHDAIRNDYSLWDQLRRASLSVALNIAEGSALPFKWFRRYLFIASASTQEVEALLQVINKLFHIASTFLQKEYQYLGKRITTLRKTLFTK